MKQLGGHASDRSDADVSFPPPQTSDDLVVDHVDVSAKLAGRNLKWGLDKEGDTKWNEEGGEGEKQRGGREGEQEVDPGDPTGAFSLDREEYSCGERGIRREGDLTGDFSLDREIPQVVDVPAGGKGDLTGNFSLDREAILPAWIAEHDLGPPRAVCNALRRLAELPDVGYTRRSEELGRAFAAWSERRHAWRPDASLDASLVVPTSDVLQGIWACVSAFSEPGEGVVLSPPVYPPFFEVCPSLGRSAHLWPLRKSSNGWFHDTDELADLLAANPGCRILLFCSPQNPTGRVYDRQSLERIVELAVEHDLVVVSDEIHADLVYPGFCHIPFLSVPGAAERAVSLFSPGKTFAVSGLRTAVAAFGSEEMHARFARRMPRHLLGDVSRAGSEAAIVAWESCERWLDSLRGLFDGHRRRIGEALAEFPEVVYHRPEATFLAWLDLSRTGLGDDPAEALLKEARLRLSPGDEFGLGGAGHVRLNFGTSSAMLGEMLRRLTGALRTRRR